MKRWNLIKAQATKIAQSALKISRDSDFIIIKDQRKLIREDLTQEELEKWGTPSFLNHLSKRASKPKPASSGLKAAGTTSEKTSGIKADIKRKLPPNRFQKPPEKGIKIIVGGPQPS